MCAVAGEFHVIGGLAEGRLDAVTPAGDDLQQDGRRGGTLLLPGGTRTAVPRAAWAPAKLQPLKPLSASRSRGAGPVLSRSAATSRSLTAAGTIAQARRSGCLGLSGSRGGSRRTTRRGRRRGRTGRAGHCPGRSSRPDCGLARGCRTGSAGIDVLAVVVGQPGGQRDPELLERTPRPADPAVGLALMRQYLEQVAPVPGHLGQEAGLAAPPQQVPDRGDGQQFGVTAGRGWPRARRDPDGPGSHQVMNQHVVDIDEQVFGPGGPRGRRAAR